MNILVTGGAGFIGSCFIRYILNKYPDYKIINLDKLTYCANLNNLNDIKNNPNYSFIKGDICNRKLIRKVIKNVDWIVNFAAESHVDNSIKNPEIFAKTNIGGVLNILEAIRESSIGKFLQISTDEVYGTAKEKESFCESSILCPNSPYSASKASADMLIAAYHKTYNIPALITRSSNNYGPNQYPEKLIPLFISRLLSNQKVPVYGDGLNTRDWMYVYDNCSAIDLVLHKGKIGEIYNIGANNEKTNLEIVDILLNALNKDKSLIEFVKDRPGHDRRYSLCCNKIKKELNWKPFMPFEEGVKQTIEWYINSMTKSH